MSITLIERTNRERHRIERDRDVIRVWHREVQADLLTDPRDLGLLAEEEQVALLLDRIECARLYGSIRPPR